MKASYGDFCGHHTEAVSYYKEQMQSNKKFHNVIRVRHINNVGPIYLYSTSCESHLSCKRHSFRYCLVLIRKSTTCPSCGG